MVFSFMLKYQIQKNQGCWICFNSLSIWVQDTCLKLMVLINSVEVLEYIQLPKFTSLSLNIYVFMKIKGLGRPLLKQKSEGLEIYTL